MVGLGRLRVLGDGPQDGRRQAVREFLPIALARRCERGPDPPGGDLGDTVGKLRRVDRFEDRL